MNDVNDCETVLLTGSNYDVSDSLTGKAAQESIRFLMSTTVRFFS